MEAIEEVEIEVEKVISSFSNYREICDNEIDNVLQSVEKTKYELNILSNPNQIDLDTRQTEIIQKICDKVQRLTSQTTKSHKNLHSTVSGIGKYIDKNFNCDFDSIADSKLLQPTENISSLNQAVAHHLLRNGMSDVALNLMKEANIPVDKKEIQRFSEITNILNSLRNKDYGPLMKWVIKNKQRLRELNSTLEFKVHRVHIIELYKKGLEKQHEIIRYAREHFSQLGPQFDQEVQHLMGAIIYLKSGIEKSPYKSFVQPETFIELEYIFISDACVLLNLSNKSAISIAIEAGSKALPSLLNIHKMLLKQGIQNIWQLRDELPVEIDLGRSLQFHSTFSCPILKQQCTESNPPMRLICGHLISRDALNKLCGNTNGKMKCPYCPQEQVVSEAVQVYF